MAGWRMAGRAGARTGARRGRGAARLGTSTGAGGGARDGTGLGAFGRSWDLVHLGNLCVDITLNVPSLPPQGRKREAAQQALVEVGEGAEVEVGGSGNVLVMGSRLGMRCAGIGHFGDDDDAGVFMRRELAKEGVELQRLEAGTSDSAGRTLECFVLLDPEKRHAFSSRYDQGPIPIFGQDFAFDKATLKNITTAGGLSLNGMTFDELPTPVIFDAAAAARANKAEVMFDPGPRAPAFGGERRAELDLTLCSATVLSLTEDELEFISPGVAPEDAAHRLLDRFGGRTGGGLDWVVVKLGPKGAFACGNFGSVFHEAYEVNLVDSVGCGDSFDAALLLGRMRGLSVQSSLRLACAAGAATAEGRGAGRNVGTLSRMSDLVEEKYGTDDRTTLFNSILA